MSKEIITLEVDEFTKEKIYKLLNKKQPMTKMTIRISETYEKALENIAKQKNTKKTKLARQVIEQFIKNYNI